MDYNKNADYFENNGCCLLFFLSLGQMTDSQYDCVIKLELQGMQQRALDKLGIDIDEVNKAIELTRFNVSHNFFNF